MSVNKCPKCGTFIFGTYCYGCQEDIKNMEMSDIFKDIFGDKNEAN